MNKQQIRKDYTIEINENGMLTSIIIEEINGMGRWVYKRNPMKRELALTDDIFEEALKVMLFENGIREVDRFYMRLYNNDPEYAQKSKKFFKNFLKTCAKSIIGQEALWGE